MTTSCRVVENYCNIYSYAIIVFFENKFELFPTKNINRVNTQQMNKPSQQTGA